MKLAWKLLLAVIVIGILLPFTLLKDDDGAPMLKFSELKWPDWRKATKKIPRAIDPSEPGVENPDTIYQWSDAEGNMQFSNSLPPEGVEFTVRNYDPNLNVIQSVNVKPGEEESQEKEDVEAKKEMTASDDLGSLYSAEGIEKLFKDANNVEKLLNQRLQNQEAILGQ